MSGWCNYVNPAAIKFWICICLGNFFFPTIFEKASELAVQFLLIGYTFLRCSIITKTSPINLLHNFLTSVRLNKIWVLPYQWSKNMTTFACYGKSQFRTAAPSLPPANLYYKTAAKLLLLGGLLLSAIVIYHDIG